MPITSPQKNYTLATSFGTLIIVAPVKRKVSGALLAWILMWVAALTWGVWFLFFSETKIAWDPLTIGLTVIFGGALLFRVYPSIVIFIRQFAITETIEINYQSVKVRRKFAGIEQAKEYGREIIEGFRVIQPAVKRFDFLRWGLASIEVQSAGPIELVCKRGNILLGFPLSHLDGTEIVDAIHRSFPDYMK